MSQRRVPFGIDTPEADERAIAEQLHLSESSIEKNATSILAKLGLSDEAQVHRRVAAVLTLLHDAGRTTPL